MSAANQHMDIDYMNMLVNIYVLVCYVNVLGAALVSLGGTMLTWSDC